MRALCLAFCAAAAALMFAQGCQLQQPKEDATYLTAAQRTEVHDIPVPVGFKMDLKRSQHSIAPGLRTGYMTYTGRATAPALLEFYKNNMPIQAWGLVRESSGGGSYSLLFEKGDEQVEVKVTPGSLMSDVTIAFFPKGSARK